MPVASRHSPVTIHQSPFTSYHSPVTIHQLHFGQSSGHFRDPLSTTCFKFYKIFKQHSGSRSCGRHYCAELFRCSALALREDFRSPVRHGRHYNKTILDTGYPSRIRGRYLLHGVFASTWRVVPRLRDRNLFPVPVMTEHNPPKQPFWTPDSDTLESR